ncbi:hypothetical protein F2Q70_00034757 [Brassica cretica]|uniref:Uncharacterized protein n=1 Tax=Brassica cretica TaxID=69181 RepID=A0A8S9JX14_BRACR|nr:hypothetical protein F2Q70_00034757 [Brassica cretica]
MDFGFSIPDLTEKPLVNLIYKPLLPIILFLRNPKHCNSTEIEPSLTHVFVPPPPPRPEPRSTSSPPIPAEGHHRDCDVETSPDQEDQPESRPDAPLRAAFVSWRSARVAQAPPPPAVVRRRR